MKFASSSVLCLLGLLFMDEPLAALASGKKGSKKSTSKESKKSSKKSKKGKKGRSPDDMCLDVTLTGTMGGPNTFNGNAQAGTLISFGTVETNCRDLKLQFDIGRGTTTQLSKIDNIAPTDIDAIFITHIHSDHVDDLAILLQNRWHLVGDPIDIICTTDVMVGDSIRSCTQLVEHIDDAYTFSGEIAQRASENPRRNPDGPSALGNLITFTPDPTTIQDVWTSEDGNVVVSSIGVNHIGGHASYRIDTPVGSVVVSGDASNDESDPTIRPYSTSDQVELLADGVDILVHAVIHPAIGPEGSNGLPPRIYHRQSNAPDVGAMAERAGAKNLVLTHLIPPVGSSRFGEPLSEGDYIRSVEEGGYEGNLHVGEDLFSLRIFEGDDKYYYD